MERPKVGVGVIVIKGEKVLLGKRKNSLGDGTWHFPGGHLEFGEAIEDCAKREVMEEAGITIKNLRPAAFINDIFLGEGRHYITLFVVAEYCSGEVKVMEPEKCETWQWLEWNNFPKPLFLPIQNLLKKGFSPFK